MDRLLVDVLIAVELYAFGDEMLNEKPSDLFPARSPLKQRHVIFAYLRGQMFNVLCCVGIAALALWASSNGWVSESTAWWISGVCVFLFLLSAATSTLAYYHSRGVNKPKSASIACRETAFNNSGNLQ